VGPKAICYNDAEVPIIFDSNLGDRCTRLYQADAAIGIGSIRYTIINADQISNTRIIQLSSSFLIL